MLPTGTASESPMSPHEQVQSWELQLAGNGYGETAEALQTFDSIWTLLGEIQGVWQGYRTNTWTNGAIWGDYPALTAVAKLMLMAWPAGEAEGAVTGTIARSLATSADEAVFWSGIGRGGAAKAASWAAQHGGATLESTLALRGVTLPACDASNPAVVAAWRQASMDFAAGARGNIRVLQGDVLRLDSIWRDEFRALRANPNVNSIRAINPDTGTETLLWSK